MEPFSLEDNLKDFGIKIKPEAELFDNNSDYYDEEEDSDEQELVYSYPRPNRYSYDESGGGGGGNNNTSGTSSGRSGSASAATATSSSASSRLLFDRSRDSNMTCTKMSGPGGGSRKRKQELSTIERDGSFPEEMTFQEYEATEAAGRLNGIGGINNDSALHMYSKRKDKPPLYLLNPDDFQHDPMKQYQIRRAIITYRHHQEKKELIRQLKDENSKLRMVVENFKKREDLMLKYCNCQRIMEIILSSNPEDILQLPPPAPKPLPSIPPLPKGRMTKQQFQQQLMLMGGTRQEDDEDDVLRDDFEPEEMLTSFTATMIEDTEEPSVTPKVGKRESRRASSSSNNSGINSIPSATDKGVRGGRNSDQEKVPSNKLNVSNGSSNAPSLELGQRRKNIGPLTISQIQRIFSLHKEKQQRLKSLEQDSNLGNTEADSPAGNKKPDIKLQNTIPKVTPINASGSRSGNVPVSATIRKVPNSTAAAVPKILPKIIAKNMRLQTLNSKPNQLRTSVTTTPLVRPIAKAQPAKQRVSTAQDKCQNGQEKVKSDDTPSGIKIKKEPAEENSEPEDPSDAIDNIATPAEAVKPATEESVKEEKPTTDIPEPEKDIRITSRPTKKVRLSTPVTSPSKLRSQSKSPEKKIPVEIKVESVEAECNQRRSKRTSAIHRPNAVDMLKGIIRKAGTRPVAAASSHLDT